MFHVRHRNCHGNLYSADNTTLAKIKVSIQSYYLKYYRAEPKCTI